MRVPRMRVIKKGTEKSNPCMLAGWTGDRDVTQCPPFPIVDDSGKVSVGEIRQNDLAF